jgi:hypothetical protein
MSKLKRFLMAWTTIGLLACVILGLGLWFWDHVFERGNRPVADSQRDSLTPVTRDGESECREPAPAGRRRLSL